MGLMHGKGTYIWENGDSYDGDYRVLFSFHSIFVYHDSDFNSTLGRQERRIRKTFSCQR
jgi:hypothetical protein